MALINKLNEIGDSIREATGKTDLFTLEEMADEIVSLGEEKNDLEEQLNNLPLEELSITENGEYLPSEGKVGFSKVSANVKADVSDALPDEAFNITGTCTYRFSNGGWDWFIELFGDKIKTENITSMMSMFNDTKLAHIPFDLNIGKSVSSFANLFYGCSNLKELPRIIAPTRISIPTSKNTFINLSNTFVNCIRLREIPNDYFDYITVDGYWEAKEALKAEGQSAGFNLCRSLRKFPVKMYKMFRSYGTAYYNSLYHNLHKNNSSLDEVVNLPVETGAYTSNCFTDTVSNCFRLKRFTFETNEDGTPKTATWSKQTITLGGTTSSLVGYAYSTSDKNYILDYNSGITADKEVKDDASYQALKNDEDWFSTTESYSRYNKISALETISTLPDVSAGSSNTIKFRGVAGAKTDGGAINTMTDAEIAVAAAKGWTVTFV